MHALRPSTFIPLLLAVFVDCNSSPPAVSATGSVQLAVSARQALSTTDITRVTVTISASDVSSLTTELFQVDGVWGGVIDNLPAGAHRSFQAQAFDSSGSVRYQGKVDDVTITAGAVTLVSLTLQSTTASTPYTNEAPIIDSVVASSTQVAPGASITLTASAHDPNAGDTLAFSWTASSGSFGTASKANTTWAASTTPGPVTLTLTVSDGHGAASSVSLKVLVTQGTGGAKIDVHFNNPPQVASLSASLGTVQVGQQTALAVSATDMEGDKLSYQWSATCAGTFDNTSAATVSFTPTALPASACNNCQVSVAVSDGQGGATTGSLSLCVAQDPTQHLPPTLVRTYQSSLTAHPAQQLAFEVEANDPENSALSFAWAATAGSLGTPVTSATTSRLVWTAPACGSGSSAPVVTATVKNAFNLTNTKSFQVTGLPACDPPGWTLAAPLITARSIHTATTLNNGKVLVSGGVNTATLASAELYDPTSNKWSSAGSMTAPREATTATLLQNGKVLVASGLTTDYYTYVTATADLYDPASNSWSSTGRMSVARSNATATLLANGKVLVVGGGNGHDWIGSSELYDPTTGTWSTTGSTSNFRFAHIAVLLPNGKVLVSGGITNLSGGAFATAELYDPVSGTWSTTGSMASARAGHTATVLLNGKVLVAGGSLATTELYDPSTGTWSTTGSMASARAGHTATLLPNGKVLVAGGVFNGTWIAMAEVYDPASGTWSSTFPMSAPRDSAGATMLSTGKVLIAGGRNSSTMATAELYTP